MLPPQVARLVETITREHAGQSVVFDADGTLWRGDVGEDFLRYGVHHGFFEGSYQHYEALLAQSAPRAYAYCVEVLAGQPLPTLEQRCAAFFAQRYAGRVFSFVRPLLARLTEAGCPVWICSASPVWTVVPGALALGIPASQVIAASCEVRDGKLTGEVSPPLPVGPGKVTWLERSALTPALAVGNGDLDLDMLAFARHALVISPPDSHNQLVLEGRARGWPILSA